MHVPDLTSDPDRHRLINLLSMLPGREDVDFWNNVGRNGPTEDATDDPAEVEPDLHGYLLGKFEIGIAQLLKEPTDGSGVAYFCQYLLMYFDGDRPTLWGYLTSRLYTGGFTDLAGERFARDLCDSAWRIIARYGGIGRPLEEKWPTPRFMA